MHLDPKCYFWIVYGYQKNPKNMLIEMKDRVCYNIHIYIYTYVYIYIYIYATMFCLCQPSAILFKHFIEDLLSSSVASCSAKAPSFCQSKQCVHSRQLHSLQFPSIKWEKDVPTFVAILHSYRPYMYNNVYIYVCVISQQKSTSAGCDPLVKSSHEGRAEGFVQAVQVETWRHVIISG